ncbi:diaminopimelate epimerase [Chloroflexota bacterium]
MINKYMEFTKLQAAGNDFILIYTRNIERDWSKLATDMCHRHYGIGADGLILLGSSSTADFNMRIINSDGSEAEICGNALRCLARYVIDNGYIDKLDLTVSTLAGIKTVEAFKSNGEITRARANMGIPRFGADEIPVQLDPANRAGEQVDIKYILDYPLEIEGTIYQVSFVNMGNPHAVCFTAGHVKYFDLSFVGPKIELNKIFPERINFEIAHVINKGEIEARVWERGAGETLACGSGACAIAIVSKIKGYTGEEVDITLPGGVLSLSWDGAGEIYLAGPVEMVFKGEWPETE